MGAAPDIAKPQFQEKAAHRSTSRILCDSTDTSLFYQVGLSYKCDSILWMKVNCDLIL